jgi:hypothetical protein
VSLAACDLSVHGDEAKNLTITSAARYTASMQPRSNLGLAEGHPGTETRRRKPRARSNSSGAVRLNFILPIKEDA